MILRYFSNASNDQYLAISYNFLQILDTNENIRACTCNIRALLQIIIKMTDFYS